MVRAATRRASAVQQGVIDSLCSRTASDMQSAEDVLAVAALAQILHDRVQTAALATTGLAPALVQLRLHVDAALQEVARMRDDREPAQPQEARRA